MSIRQTLVRWLLPPGIFVAAKRAKSRAGKWTRLSVNDRHLLRQTRQLSRRHAGQRCFILGAGSSIKRQDLRKLRGEIVLSVSNTFVHPDYSFFSPRYHFVPPMVASHGQLYPHERFVEWLREMETATLDAEMFFHIGDRRWIEEKRLFRGRTIHWVDYYNWAGESFDAIDLADLPSIWSVSELALSAAVFMGFERIYLLGIDHDWFNGPLIYFYDPETEHKVRPNKETLVFADAEFQMRRHADIFRKYKNLQSIHRNIFNANADPGHYLDVFPKADYDSLFGLAGGVEKSGSRASDRGL
jgi:hypothetical protein